MFCINIYLKMGNDYVHDYKMGSEKSSFMEILIALDFNIILGMLLKDRKIITNNQYIKIKYTDLRKNGEKINTF